MMKRRWLCLAVILAALSGGACDFAPVCPANTEYDGTIRRCRPLPADGGTPEERDAQTPPAEDGGAGGDAGDDGGATADDGGTTDDGGTIDDGGTTDDGGPEDAGGGGGGGGGGMRDR